MIKYSISICVNCFVDKLFYTFPLEYFLYHKNVKILGKEEFSKSYILRQADVKESLLILS